MRKYIKSVLTRSTKDTWNTWKKLYNLYSYGFRQYTYSQPLNMWILEVVAKDIVSPWSWSSWHHPCCDPAKTFSQNKFSFPLLVFNSAVLSPLKHEISCFASFIWVCNVNMGLRFQCRVPASTFAKMYMGLQFWHHLIQHLLRGPLVHPLSLWPWPLELHLSHSSPWKTTKN
jgi:hypothetical protein